VSKKRRQSQFKSFVISEDMELLIKIAKFSGNSLSRFAFYWINPSIKFHRKIYIGKKYQRQTISGLNKTLDDFLMAGSTDYDTKLHRKKFRSASSYCVMQAPDLELKQETFSYSHKTGLMCLSKY
jgi:hypothetical protein